MCVQMGIITPLHSLFVDRVLEERKPAHLHQHSAVHLIRGQRLAAAIIAIILVVLARILMSHV